jgi:hypothetical protein
MKTISIFLLFALFCSCTKTLHNDHAVDDLLTDTNEKLKLASDTTAELGKVFEATMEPADKVQVLLQFENLTITTEFEEVWTDGDYFTQVHKDTILIQLGLVSKISGQTYMLKPAMSIETIQIYQNYETSLTIMDEGPHVDLIDWIHFIGEWNELEIKNNRFKTLEYSDLDQEKFPPVTSDQILEATKKHLNVDSSRWTDLVRQCTGPNKYPCGVSVSRINLRIVLTDNKGITTEKYVIMEIPMGC